MNKAVVILVLALAVAGVGLFFAMTRMSDLDDPGLGGGDGPEATLDPLTESGRADAASDGRSSGRGPSLFGRAHLRIGVGNAIGRLVDFVTKEPVAGASIRLSGTGHGEEKIAVEVQSGEDGRFQLKEVPAGEDLELDVLVDDQAARTLTGLVIAARKVEDFGTIWLGDAGTLEGRVIGLDGKGIVDAEIRVLQGKFSQEEMMRDLFGFLSTLDRDPPAVAQGRSGAGGRFQIERVPPGPITVVARAPGHYQATLATAMTKDGALGGAIELRLGPAEPITGRVVTEEGRGLPGARIAFMDQEDEENGFIGRRFVETDARGGFRVEAPGPARRLLAIVAAEGYPTLFSGVEGQQSDLEFVLTGGARLRLRIVHDDTGEPVGDAAIVAMLNESENMGNSGTFLTGVTDAAGRLEFAARPGFIMMVMLQHPEHGAGFYSPQLGAMGGVQGLAMKGPEKLQLRRGDNEAELRKPRGVLLTGKVSDEAGLGVAGATVTTAGSPIGFGGGTKTLTDESGTYRLVVPAMPGMPVLVEATGFVQDPSQRMPEITPGASTLQHDVTLLKASRIEGKVVGPAGGPAVGIEVGLRQAEREDGDIELMMGAGAAGPGTAISDAQGRFLLEDVAPGVEYYLLGRGAGYVVTNSDRFDVKKGGTTTRAPLLKMKLGAAVQVEVRNPMGRPAIGARIEVRVDRRPPIRWTDMDRWRAFATLVTDAKGMAEVKDLPDGTVTLTADAKDAAPARLQVAIAAADPDTSLVVLRLRPALLVRGTLRDQHGDAVQGARVGTSGAGWQSPGEAAGAGEQTAWVPSRQTRTDRFGRFVLEGIPTDAKVRLSVSAEGHVGNAFPLEGRADALQLVIEKIDPEVQRRRAELQSEMMALYGQMQSVETDAERQALMERIQAINEELSGLEGGPGMVDRAEAEENIEER